MGTMVNEYRGYYIFFEPVPVPSKKFDYQFVHKDFDGAPDSGDSRYGAAPSVQECIDKIDELEDEMT